MNFVTILNFLEKNKTSDRLKYSEFQNYFPKFSPKVIFLLRNCPLMLYTQPKLMMWYIAHANILQKQIRVIAELLRPENKAQNMKGIVPGHV